MQTSFVDFLNHGLLPFIGRGEEQKQIFRFWRSPDVDHSELHIALMLGEAGSGKSRLIDETLPLIEEQGGCVLHVKLRPEGSTSFAPLIAMGIERSESARRLVPRLPDTSISAAIGAMRRLCGLRRTLLVIEDIHLLAGETLREFALLVEALADEPLAMLAAARPLELAARGIIEGYLVEEMVLDRLSSEDIGQIWQEMFSSEPPPEALQALMQSTMGNALAIRSALRGSLRSGSVIRQERSGQWQMQINLGAFGEIVQRSTHGIVGGMIADLSAEQIDAVKRLALLGEVFSQEAAEVMVAEAEKMVESLIFKGILAHSTTAVTPLDDRTSARLPIAFTHTLLHDALSHIPDEIPEQLLSAIASGAPIYSLLPIRILRRLSSSSSLSHEDLEEAIARISLLTVVMDNTTSWQEAIPMLDTGEHLATLLDPLVSPLRIKEVRAGLIGQRLYLQRRNIASPDYKKLADDLYRQTIENTSPSLLQRRFDAINHLFRYSVTCDRRYDQDLLDQAFAMAEQDHTLRTSKPFLALLNSLGTYTVNYPTAERALAERIEAVMENLLSENESDKEFHDYVFYTLARYFMTRFSTPEMFEKRKEMVDKLERMSRPDDLAFQTFHLRFLINAGWSDQFLERLSQLIQQLQDQGLTTHLMLRNLEAIAHGMIGHDIESIIARTRQQLAELEGQQQRMEHQAAISGFHLHLIALFRGDVNHARDIHTEFFLGEEKLHQYNCILQWLWEERIDHLRAIVNDLPPTDEDLRLCMNICLGYVSPDNSFMEGYGDFQDLPVVSIYSFTIIYIRISLLEHALRNDYIAPSLNVSARITSVVNTCLEWFAERKLYACMSPLLDRHGHHLPTRDLSRWRSLTETIERERKQKAEAHGSDRLRITMIGAITVQHRGSDAQRLRGGRNQIALGLLVANAMLKRPLDRGTFFALATGIPDAPERARTTWNIAALRLREAIGRDALVTDDDVPKLNMATVHVDLLEAWEELANAETALHRHHLVGAWEACITALNLAAGKVIFPTLYDELFETLRDDFENRLRQTTLNTARSLAEAGDLEGAESLLQRYSTAIPDDEESAVLLATLLTQQNRKSETLLIRAKTSEQLDT
jgi:hypothetical protein